MINQVLWLRWAISRSEFVRAKIREVTGIYNQWPIILERAAHYLPIDQLPPSSYFVANDNARP